MFRSVARRSSIICSCSFFRLSSVAGENPNTRSLLVVSRSLYIPRLLSRSFSTSIHNMTQKKSKKPTGPVETKGKEDPKSAGSLKQPEGDDDWKYRAPYKVHDNPNDFKVIHEAKCHCGKVQYQLSREVPLASKFCHCTTCQRLHGAAFQWAAIFHKEDINFTHGHHDLVWYDPSEKTTRHKLPCKVSCGHCRTPIMDEGRNMILLFPTLVDFKSKQARDKWAPSCHMFYPQRVVDITDGKPKLERLDNDEKKEMPRELW